MSTNCPNCGAPWSLESSVCDYCGTPKSEKVSRNSNPKPENLHNNESTASLNNLGGLDLSFCAMASPLDFRFSNSINSYSDCFSTIQNLYNTTQSQMVSNTELLQQTLQSNQPLFNTSDLTNCASYLHPINIYPTSHEDSKDGNIDISGIMIVAAFAFSVAVAFIILITLL